MKYAYDRMNIDVPGGIDWLHSSMHHSCLVKEKRGHSENRTRDLSHPKRESYH